MSYTIQNNEGNIRNIYNCLIDMITPDKPTEFHVNNVIDMTTNVRETDRNDMEAAIKQGYKPHLEKTSKIKNSFYQGDTYVVKFNEYNVTIINRTKNYTKKINLSNLLRGMKQDDKIKFLKEIQKYPAEVLEDLSVECDRITSSTNQNMNTCSSNPNFVAGGYYSGSKDSIVTAPQHLVHELGHAIDYQGKGNMSGKKNRSAILKNKDFIRAYNMGLNRYIKAGGKKYDYNNQSTWSKPTDKILQKSNYCTANPKELWAELYTAMMTGSCQSIKTIATYFPEAIEIGKNFLQEVRSEHSQNRHNSPIRQNIETLSLIT